MNFLPLPTNLFPYWLFPWNSNSWSDFTQFVFHKELLAIDAVRQLFPWKAFGFELIKKGEWPLWNPYAFSGQPLLANLQSSFFYPFTWFFLFLKSDQAWSIYIYLQPIILALGILLWFRVKKNSLFSSTVLAGTIILSSFFVTRYFWGVYLHSVIWIPWGLALVEIANNKKQLIRPILGTAIVYALTILGGYPQHSIFALAVMIGFTILKLGKRGVAMFTIAIALALGLTAIQLFPSAELYQNSARDIATSASQFANSQLKPEHLLTLLSPDFYGSPGVNNFFGKGDYSGSNNYFGIIPLALAIGSLLIKKTREHLFWIGVVLYGFLASYATPISFLPKLLGIPILSSGAAWNNTFFIQVGGAILAAITVQKLLVDGNRLPLKLGSLIVLVLSGLVLLLSLKSDISLKNTLPYALISLLAFLSTFLPTKWLKLSLIGLLILPGLYLFSKVSPFGEMKYFYPPHPVVTFLKQNGKENRFWGIGGQTIPSNLATYYGVYDPQGYDSLWPKWYGEFVSAAASEPNRSFDRAVVNIPKEDTEKTEKLINFLGIKYYLDNSDNPKGNEEVDILKYPPEKFTRVRRFGQVNIFENKQSYPRAFFIKQVVNSPVENQLDMFYSSSFNPLTQVLIDSKEVPPKEYAVGEAKIINYQTQKVAIATTLLEKTGVLVLTDTFYPGWKAFIDEKQTPLLRADYAFRAVIVPQGNHTVTFVYDPESFRVGKTVSIASLLLILGLFTWSKFVKNDSR